MVRNDTRGTSEMNSGLPIKQQQVTRSRLFCTGKFDLNLRKKLVKCQIWGTAIGGVEALTQRKVFVKIFLTTTQFTLNYYIIPKRSVHIPKYFVGGQHESKNTLTKNCLVKPRP
jgi:hypothetical protein